MSLRDKEAIRHARLSKMKENNEPLSSKQQKQLKKLEEKRNPSVTSGFSEIQKLIPNLKIPFFYAADKQHPLYHEHEAIHKKYGFPCDGDTVYHQL